MYSLTLDSRFKLKYGEVWAPIAGRPIIVEMGKGVVFKGNEAPFEKLDFSVEPKVVHV